MVGYFFTPNIVVSLLYLTAKKNILALLYGYYVQQNLPKFYSVQYGIASRTTNPSLIYKEEITVGGQGGGGEGEERKGKGRAKKKGEGVGEGEGGS